MSGTVETAFAVILAVAAALVLAGLGYPWKLYRYQRAWTPLAPRRPPANPARPARHHPHIHREPRQRRARDPAHDHIPTDLAMSDAIWRIVNKHWKELGSDPRDVVADNAPRPRSSPRSGPTSATSGSSPRGGIDYEQHVRDTDAALEDVDDAPAAVGHEPMFEIDSAVLARASKAIKVTSLADIRNLDNAEDDEIDEVEVA